MNDGAARLPGEIHPALSRPDNRADGRGRSFEKQARLLVQIFATGQADAVCLARQLPGEPYFPLHAARKLRADVAWPNPYERAKPR